MIKEKKVFCRGKISKERGGRESCEDDTSAGQKAIQFQTKCPHEKKGKGAQLEESSIRGMYRWRDIGR